MKWKLISQNHDVLQEVNCEYDGCDIAVLAFQASKVEVDFIKCEVRILAVLEDEESP